jgi:dTDP-D-glucose 4,6-dehydratase
MSTQSKTPRFKPSLGNPCYVVAGSQKEYRDWLHKNDHDVLHYSYVYNTDTLVGLSEIHGVYIGTWRERKDIEEIKERIAIIKSRQNKSTVADIVTDVVTDRIDTVGDAIQQDIDRAIVDYAIQKPSRTLEELEAYIDDYVRRNRIYTGED